MSYWARRDAERLHRRVRHLAYRCQPLTPEQVAYLRGQTTHLLIGPLADTLPDTWTDDLRDLLWILESLAADLEDAA